MLKQIIPKVKYSLFYEICVHNSYIIKMYTSVKSNIDKNQIVIVKQKCLFFHFLGINTKMNELIFNLVIFRNDQYIKIKNHYDYILINFLSGDTKKNTLLK